ncbi:hypothetical protein F2P81_023895 [Scophthalmus maximus]|uniref:Uncharacterized protein n=1 Tax=Scophthalmus maximus TaxID=52904 RepID=A0A6A4RSW6_SCOMX|nr:hypothetical protein F2P81_023895 [Scophthalmus maximus]
MIHLRTRGLLSSFSTPERKRQDGPPAALLESPQKIRTGIPLLVSPAVNLSTIDIRAEKGPVEMCWQPPVLDNSPPDVYRMGAGRELTWRWRMCPANSSSAAAVELSAHCILNEIAADEFPEIIKHARKIMNGSWGKWCFAIQQVEPLKILVAVKLR